MSGLASNLFRRVDGGQPVAPGFIRVFFSKLGAMKIKGPTGVYVPVPMCSMVNNASTAVNASTSRAVVSLRDIVSGQETNPGLFTKTFDGIIVNESGYYDVYTSLYQEGTTARTNVGVLIHRGGMLPANVVQGASGYIRDNGGHNESSSDISNILKLNAGDKITVSYKQLAAAGTVTAPAGTAILSVKKIG